MINCRNTTILCIWVCNKSRNENKYNIWAAALGNASSREASCSSVQWDRCLSELPAMKYKGSTDKVLQIEPKEDLNKRAGKSPNFA